MDDPEEYTPPNRWVRDTKTGRIVHHSFCRYASCGYAWAWANRMFTTIEAMEAHIDAPFSYQRRCKVCWKIEA